MTNSKLITSIIAVLSIATVGFGCVDTKRAPSRETRETEMLKAPEAQKAQMESVAAYL